VQELGFPWVMRKMLIKYGSKSTDIIKQKGSSMTVTTVNAKGSWTRTLATDRTLQQVHVLP
jgi:hypothetical protein